MTTISLFRRLFSGHALLCIFLLMLLAPACGSAQDSIHVEVIIDASVSMKERIGKRRKIDLLKEFLPGALQSFGEHSILGVRAFGHRHPETNKEASCKDIEVLQAAASGILPETLSRISSLSPAGYSPLSASLRQAASLRPSAILIVTDGSDTCDGNLYQTAAELRAEGINVQLHIVGLAVNGAAERDFKNVSSSFGGSFEPILPGLDPMRALQLSFDAISEGMKTGDAGSPVDAGDERSTAILVHYDTSVSAVLGDKDTQDVFFCRAEIGEKFRVTARTPAGRVQLEVLGADGSALTSGAVIGGRKFQSEIFSVFHDDAFYLVFKNDAESSEPLPYEFMIETMQSFH